MGRRSARIGRWAEDLAVQYLLERGYGVLQRNFRGGGGELDIVCRRADTIYFVEVKERGPNAWYTPAQAVTPDKRRRLYQAAQLWLQKNLHDEAACGFLLLTVTAKPQGGPVIDLIEDFWQW